MRLPSRNALVRVGFLAALVLAVTSRPTPRLSEHPAAVSPESAPIPRKVRELKLPLLSQARDLPKGSVHAYSVPLKEDEYLELRIEQKEVDLKVELLDSSRHHLYTVDSPSGLEGAEEVFLVGPPQGGELRAELSSDEGEGSYVLRVVARRPARERDRSRAQASEEFYRAWGVKHRQRDEAIAGFRRAGGLFESIEEWSWVRESESQLGKLFSRQWDHREAAGHFRLAAKLARRLGRKDKEAEARTLLASELLGLSQLGEAEAELGRALALARQANDIDYQSGAESGLGDVAMHRGSLEAARDHYRRALTLSKKAGNTVGEVKALSRLGTLLSRLGDLANAARNLETALQTPEAKNDARLMGILHSRIAEVAMKQRNYPLAQEHYREALALRQQSKDLGGEATTLSGLGVLLSKQGEYDEARTLHERALKIYTDLAKPRDVARVRCNLGVIHLGRGETGLAERNFEEALSRAGDDREVEAAALLGLARVDRQRGNPQASRLKSEKALGIIESSGDALSRSDHLSSYQAAWQDQYDFLVDLLVVELSSLGAALDVAERSRGRGLLAVIARSGPLAAAEPGERERLIQLDAELARLDEAAANGGRDQLRISSLLNERIDLVETIRGRNPWLSSLGRPATLKAIQSDLLDENTILLQYHIAGKRSFLWVVSPSTVDIFELAGRDLLEPAARKAASLVEKSHFKIREPRAREALLELSRLLLGPAKHLLGKKRLAIIPHGPLYSIPFAALPDPNEEGKAHEGWPIPLVHNHEIIILPSMSVLQALRARSGQKSRGEGYLAVLGEPKFADKTKAKSGKTYSPLAYSGKEARAIVELTGDRPTLLALEAAANKDLVLSGALGRYQIVHFATHARLNALVPELSNLVLSEESPDGRSIDGLLRTYEIASLDLPAELVVLSACETALGREIRGEGIMGLSQAFFQAGARRVVQSLWSVDDQATAELMVRFHRGLHGGLRPAAALRQAQVEMSRSVKFQAPNYWAAFFLQGDWR